MPCPTQLPGDLSPTLQGHLSIKSLQCFEEDRIDGPKLTVIQLFDIYLLNNYIENTRVAGIRVLCAVDPEIHFMKQIVSISNQLIPLLQAARKSAGLSQTELAKRLDLSQSRMSAIELDPASMRLDQLLSICATLHLELVVQTKGAPEPSQVGPTQPEW